MGTINERDDQNGNTRYQAIIRIKGHPTQTETFSTVTHAKRWIQQTEAAIREGRSFKVAEAKKHTLGEMIDRYTKQFNPPAYKLAQLIWWKNRLGYCLLCDVTPALIAEGRDELLQGMTPRGQRTPSTTVRYIAALSHVFTVGIKEFGWIETSPVSKIVKPREPAGRVRFLNDEELERLLEACKNHRNPLLYIVVVLAISTGMRQDEIMSLTWQQIDLNRKYILLEKTKNKTRRTVPLAGLALKLLHKHYTKQVSFRFETKENGQGIKCVHREAKKDTAEVRELKELVHARHDDVVEDCISSAASAHGSNYANQLNIMVQILAEFSPKDLHESRLCLQAANLFSEGMRYLGKANQADMFCHSEFYMKSAIKLLRLHNETVETLNRYKRGGEQKIVVQHSVLADKAIVNFPGGGANTKNEGDTPCSTNYAAQKPEPTAINHVGSPPWPTEDADCMEAKAQVLNRSKERNE